MLSSLLKQKLKIKETRLIHRLRLGVYWNSEVSSWHFVKKNLWSCITWVLGMEIIKSGSCFLAAMQNTRREKRVPGILLEIQDGHFFSSFEKQNFAREIFFLFESFNRRPLSNPLLHVSVTGRYRRLLTKDRENVKDLKVLWNFDDSKGTGMRIFIALVKGEHEILICSWKLVGWNCHARHPEA